MFNIVFIIALFANLGAQDKLYYPNGWLKTYTYVDKNGDKVVETYDKLLLWPEDYGEHKKGDPVLITKLYYIGETDTKQKKEKFRRLDGTLKSTEHYKDNSVYKEEFFYAKDYTFKNGRRNLLQSAKYYYPSCECEEFYNGFSSIQYKVVTKQGTAPATVTKSELGCKTESEACMR